MPSPAALPTDAELQVLRVLWSRGPSTVHQVHAALYGSTGVGYTTSLKLLQNLYAKALVTRDEDRRQHVYAAAVAEAATMQRVLRQLIDRTFNGSAAALAVHALGAKRASARELDELKRLIGELERGGGRQ